MNDIICVYAADMLHDNNIDIYIPVKSIKYITGIYDKGEDYIAHRFRFDIRLLNDEDLVLGFKDKKAALEAHNLYLSFYNRKSWLES